MSIFIRSWDGSKWNPKFWKYTPLHSTAYYNHLDIVKLLIEYGAEINLKNNYNNLALDEAYFPKIKEILMNGNKDLIQNFILI